MNGKEFRLIDDILQRSQFEKDDVFEDVEFDEIKDEAFQTLRRNYLFAKSNLCEFLGYE